MVLNRQDAFAGVGRDVMTPLLRIVATAVAGAALSGTAVAQGTGGVFVDSTTCLVKPRQVVQLGSSVYGVISAVLVDRGDTVQQGQLLAKLDTSVEEAQVALDRFRATNTTQMEAARTDMAWNQRELARRQQLVGNMFSKANEVDEIVTKIDQDRIAIRKAEADQKTAMLEAERSEAQLRLKLIKSPVNGVVTELKMMPGEFIHEQATIMTIAQIDPLYVDLIVPADRYGPLKLGATADVRLGSPMNTVASAVIDAIDPVIDPASDTFRVRLVLPNPERKIPSGIRCSVRLPQDTVAGG